MLNHLLIVLSGAIFTIAAIAGIGPQNLNIISHAIKKHYAMEVALTCFIADIILIITGGIGLSLTDSHSIIFFINIVGIVFIVWYLYNKIKILFKTRTKLIIDECHDTKTQAILHALALTWLNPLVFLDTIVVIGGTATHYSGFSRVDFIAGALIGSFTWTFSITYLAKRFSEQLNRSYIWILLDIITIIIMTVILYKTVMFVIT